MLNRLRSAGTMCHPGTNWWLESERVVSFWNRQLARFPDSVNDFCLDRSEVGFRVLRGSNYSRRKHGDKLGSWQSWDVHRPTSKDARSSASSPETSSHFQLTMSKIRARTTFPIWTSYCARRERKPLETIFWQISTVGKKGKSFDLSKQTGTNFVKRKERDRARLFT